MAQSRKVNAKVKAGIKVIGEVCHDTACDSHCHSEYIDEDEHFVLHHTAKGDEEIIFDHKES